MGSGSQSSAPDAPEEPPATPSPPAEGAPQDGAAQGGAPGSPGSPGSPTMPAREKEQSQRPEDTPLRQQRLYAWQPVYGTMSTVLCLVAVAVVTLPLGATMLVARDDIVKVEVRYDTASNFTGCAWVGNDTRCVEDCLERSEKPACANQAACGMVANLPIHCPRRFEHAATTGPTGTRWMQNQYNLTDCDPHCNGYVDFTITETMHQPVYLYYRLTRFYQNHRKYVESRSETQLAGDEPLFLSECAPLLNPGNYIARDGQKEFCRRESKASYEAQGDAAGGEGCDELHLRLKGNGDVEKLGDLTYAPCGLPAWSRFNDSLMLARMDGEQEVVLCDGEYDNERDDPGYKTAEVEQDRRAKMRPRPPNHVCRKEGIAWSVDRNQKFRDPRETTKLFDTRGLDAEAVETKHAWLRPYLLYGWYANEPYHRLPYQRDEDFIVWSRISMMSDFQKLYRVIDRDLEPGTYRMRIKHRFNTEPYGGEKHFILSTATWTGGTMVFFSILLLVCGCIAFVAAVFFMGYHIATQKDRASTLAKWQLEAKLRAEKYNQH